MIKRQTVSGQSLVEFALIFPLIILLLMGLFDIGRAVFYYSTLNTAVREGTRLAIIQPDCDYMSNPGECDGGYLETYPLDCASAASTANIKICDDIENKFFAIGEFVRKHNIRSIIRFQAPMTLKLTLLLIMYFHQSPRESLLIGDLTMHVNSHMLMTPIALP